MAYNLEYDGKWKAFVDYGDDFPMMFAITEDNIPVDLTGQTLVLGIKKSGVVLCEVVGAVSGNEVTFFIGFNNLKVGGVVTGTYTFDFWNETNRYTYIQEGTFKVDPVSHEVD